MDQDIEQSNLSFSQPAERDIGSAASGCKLVSLLVHCAPSKSQARDTPWPSHGTVWKRAHGALREIHDKLRTDAKASGDYNRCIGTIYRSYRVVARKEHLVGNRELPGGKQNPIHAEHAIPVASLRDFIFQNPRVFSDPRNVARFIMDTQFVTCVIANCCDSEKVACDVGWRDKHPCFLESTAIPNSADSYEKVLAWLKTVRPFARYIDTGIKIHSFLREWKCIDVSRFTISEHMDEMMKHREYCLVRTALVNQNWADVLPSGFRRKGKTLPPCCHVTSRGSARAYNGNQKPSESRVG